LLKSEIRKSKLTVEVQNDVILSDFIINKDLIINAAYYSTEESNFNKREEFTTLFIKFDELNSTISNYDYNSNKNFIPVSYKFTKINENDYYIGSIAIPIDGTQAGYFISKNSFGSKIDFNSSSVITATDFLKDENWSNKDKKLISKGKCPISYRHEKLTDFFITNGNINFISLKLYNLGSDNGGSSTMNASSASSVGGITTVGMASGGGADPMEGNITFASFKLESNKPIVFFKTLEKQSSDLSSTSNNFFYIIDEAKIDIFFTIEIFSDEFNFTKKETGISFLSGSEILKLTYNFSEKTKKFNLRKNHIHIFLNIVLF
jgi:hypothetical protein